MRTIRIDVHHHLLTPEYLEEPTRVGMVESGSVPSAHWTPEDLLLVLDRAGMQTSISTPGLCFGNAVRERAVAHALNEYAAESVTRWPKRFGFFAALPLPDMEAALAEVSYVLLADGIGTVFPPSWRKPVFLSFCLLPALTAMMRPLAHPYPFI